jgi:hypothetical protein
MKRLTFSLVLALSITLFLTGCGSSSQNPTPSPSPSASATVTHKQSAEIFYVGDTPKGFKLFSEAYPVPDSTLASLANLISDLVTGVARPLDPDYFNLWGRGSSLRSIKVVPPVATVDLHMGKLNVGAEAEMRAIDEIFWTISRFTPNITKMDILVDGKKTESLAGHVNASQTFTLEPTYVVLNNLQISSIYEGERITSPVTISGEACTFEANVAWKLAQGTKILRSGAVTAQEACPTRSNWTLSLGKLLPGKYQLTVQDFSAKDGSLVAKDNKDFVVVKSS